MPAYPPVGAGGAVAGTPIVRAFPFAFDTPDILTGAAVYTPTVGELLMDAWIEVVTAWDGTTPKADIGQFFDSTTGLYGEVGGTRNMSQADAPLFFGSGYVGNSSASSIQLAATSGVNGRVAPGRFTATHPLKIVVSQDGTNIAADPASTQGAAILYLVTATPA